MRSFFAVFTILISAMLTSALVVRNYEPPCDCTCPYSDNYGHPLGNSKIDNGNLCCYYEDDKKYCSYNEKTGYLVADYDDGKCPYQAKCNKPPTPVYECPYSDFYGHHLGMYKTENGNLCCYYEDHNKYCSYDEKTGNLVGDYDDGKCQSQASVKSGSG